LSFSVVKVNYDILLLFLVQYNFSIASACLVQVMQLTIFEIGSKI